MAENKEVVVGGEKISKLRELCKCEKILEDEQVLALGRIDDTVETAEDNVESGDEIDEILEAENRKLNDVLELPADTYSLTLISPNLPSCVRYGVRSGLTHHRMRNFSPLSRGFQGPAIAIAALATNSLVRARCWNEMIIDQIVDDGDTYYCRSYEERHMDDRRNLTILDLKRDLAIQKTHRGYVTIEEPAYAGKFRSSDPTILHVVKALELFFKRYDAGILVSSVLNVAIWRDSKYFNIFDSQARGSDLSIMVHDDDDDGARGSALPGAAKLILVRDMTGVLFVVLEKSGVKNENFVIHRASVRGIQRIPIIEEDPEEPEKSIGKPERRPSGYKIRAPFRALVQASFHLEHELVPVELRGRSHLILALAAIIYSRLIPANKWTNAMLDLMFNQSHIYLVDLARVLEKKLDDRGFELKIDDVIGDVILGAYAAKVNVHVNVIPGLAKKGKTTLDTGIRDFFKSNASGILEIKKIFYALWKDGEKYYFFDPFACDEEGFRVDLNDPENAQRYGKALACVTMNSSVNELIEQILENTGNKEKDAFVIHGLSVLYVKTGSNLDDPLMDRLIYREKKLNRRPVPHDRGGPEHEDEPDDCKIVMNNMIPRPRANAESTKAASSQYPELMKRIENYMMREDEATTFIIEEALSSNDDDNNINNQSFEDDEEKKPQVHFQEQPTRAGSMRESSSLNPEHAEDVAVESSIGAEMAADEIEFIRGYRIVNPHRIILHGSKNCLSEEFASIYRGRQGLVLALTAIAYSKIKEPENWRNIDIDQILRVGDLANMDIVGWIRQGSPSAQLSPELDTEENDEQDEDEDDKMETEEEDDEEEQDKEDDEGKLKSFGRVIGANPSHIELRMLPDRLTLGENNVDIKKRESAMAGVADPLANLGEAVERYFEKYNEAILENKRLMYGIWKQDEKYFILNPYGSDEEGWRCRDHPASLIVTDTLNELVDVLHSILEFNDATFSLHYVSIDSIQPGDKYVPPSVTPLVPKEGIVEKYETRFLPVTDQDLVVPSESEKPIEAEEGKSSSLEVTTAENDEQDDDDEEEEDKEKEEIFEEKVESSEKMLPDPLLEVEEQEFPETPERLNLSLLTGSVKIERDFVPSDEFTETIFYERLKYSHPPPYVLPPNKVLCILLEAKRASGSMHSLLSRFSIDSKLAVKAATDLPSEAEPATATLVSSDDEGKSTTTKMIKLPPKKYLFSRVPTDLGFTPIRAINEMFIQDEELDRAWEDECRRARLADHPVEFDVIEAPELPINIRIRPEIIPLGPPIKTPSPKKVGKSCPERSNKVRNKCRISDEQREEDIFRKMICETEDLLLDVIFSSKKIKAEDERPLEETTTTTSMKNKDEGRVNEEAAIIGDEEFSSVNREEEKEEEEGVSSPQQGIKNSPEETRGFMEAEGNVGIITGNMSLKDRETTNECHLKACYFAAMFCILAKVRTNIDKFRGSILDQFVLAAEKIYRRIPALRYKAVRYFRNIVVLGLKCHVIMKQTAYADPVNCEADEFSLMLDAHFEKHSTGILVLENASYAFWSSSAEGNYYLFDPYGCDANGKATTDGRACLLKFCSLDELVQRIEFNNPGGRTEKPFRLYTIGIAHLESTKKKRESKKNNNRRRRRRRRRRRCSKEASEEEIRSNLGDDPEPSSGDEDIEPKREVSLIEVAEWVVSNKRREEEEEEEEEVDPTIPGFFGIKNCDASALEVPVVENDVTRPLLPPFKKIMKKLLVVDPMNPPRRKPYDRKFKEETCVGETLDLCIIAWSCVHDPLVWGVRTIRAIYEAARELAYDSLLAAMDSNSPGSDTMTDGILSEFSIGNYYFRAVFGPHLHRGKLYAMEGWNLAMSIKKLLEIPIYSGGILICGKAHIGIMKKGENHYAWWTVARTKNLRIITSKVFQDFLKLLVRCINVSEERDFLMRIVTISYARKLDPDCSDMLGLHEPAVPATSLAQIHRKSSPPYDLEAIFRPTVPNPKPIFILGTVAFNDRDTLTEPRVKRCYFVAVLSLMIKRDIVQSPMPGMIDRILEVAENLYREFDQPKYHTEHIIRNLTIMNRIFDFRDSASEMRLFAIHPITGKSDFFSLVRKRVRKHFVRNTDGIVHFSNCSYGFWYSRVTNAYYYIDPYQCDAKGRRVKKSRGAAASLCIFSSICDMVKNWCKNRSEDTTGFFIHRLHVESINVPATEKFREDPMWVYLDYQWSFEHSILHSNKDADMMRKRRTRRRRRKIPEEDDACGGEAKEERGKLLWNNYVIEIPSLIYSIWGTIGSYDARFGERAGSNRDAICIAILSMRYLCHPTRWSAAILDSAVICGDSYYTESMRSSAKRGRTYENRFNLQPCFKVFPHIWRIEFMASVCGIIYGGKGRPDLATSLKYTLEESSNNLVLQCEKVTLAILSAGADFYVVDPCWTGPPLFTRNHGAIYGLRCRNMNSLVYVITKILNTNQRLEFRISPISLSFSQEMCKLADRKKLMKKEILVDPFGDEPGEAAGPKLPVSGAITQPAEDPFLLYRENLHRGIIHGEELENPKVRSPVPPIKYETEKNCLLSTTWHLNIGKEKMKKRSRPAYDPSLVALDPRLCPRLRNLSIHRPRVSSIEEEIQLCDDYPRAIDFAVGRIARQSTKILTKRKSKSYEEEPLTKPLDCIGPRTFLMESSRREFNRSNKEMRDKAYATISHRRIKDDEEEPDTNQIEI